jgi:hypothetical protein
MKKVDEAFSYTDSRIDRAIQPLTRKEREKEINVEK